MPLRLVTLEPSDQYFLDAAQEYDDLDPTSYLTLRLFGDRDEIHHAVDARPVPLEGETVLEHFTHGSMNGWRDRAARCERLKNIADRILTEIDQSEAGGLVWPSTRQLPRKLHGHAEIFAYMAYEDITIGGSMADFKHGKDRNVDRYGYPTKRIARRLNSPSFIRRFVRSQRETAGYRRDVDRHLMRMAIVPPEFIRDTTAEIEEQLRQQFKVEERRRGEMFRENVTDVEFGTVDRRPLVRLKKGGVHTRRQRRKMLRRAASTAVAVIGREKVSDLVQGKTIQIVGEKMMFLVACRGIGRLGHGGLDLAVADLSGQRLASLCYYYEKTPAIDQVTALALDVAGGEEEEVLRTANLTVVTDAGYAHPLLEDRTKPPRREEVAQEVAIAPPGRTERQQRVYDWDIQQKLNKDYWHRTKGIWIDALCSQLFPDRGLAKLMMRAIDVVQNQHHVSDQLAPRGYIDEQVM